MSAMGGAPMPGGWTMSMVWMRMPGQTWPGAAASFVVMWVVMMVAMMLPSLVPMLSRYRQAVCTTAGGTRIGCLTAIVGTGYVVIWTAVGVVVFPLGIALAAIAVRQPALARSVPLGVGAVLLVVGLLQFTNWKERGLARCSRSPRPGRALSVDDPRHRPARFMPRTRVT